MQWRDRRLRMTVDQRSEMNRKKMKFNAKFNVNLQMSTFPVVYMLTYIYGSHSVFQSSQEYQSLIFNEWNAWNVFSPSCYRFCIVSFHLWTQFFAFSVTFFLSPSFSLSSVCILISDQWYMFSSPLRDFLAYRAEEFLLTGFCRKVAKNKKIFKIFSMIIFLFCSLIFQTIKFLFKCGNLTWLINSIIYGGPDVIE